MINQHIFANRNWSKFACNFDLGLTCISWLKLRQAWCCHQCKQKRSAVQLVFLPLFYNVAATCAGHLHYLLAATGCTTQTIGRSTLSCHASAADGVQTHKLRLSNGKGTGCSYASMQTSGTFSIADAKFVSLYSTSG